MSNVFTLDSLRAEADKAFKPLIVPLSDGTESVLKNILRLAKPVREEILAAVDTLNKDETTVNELSEAVEAIIALAATNPDQLLADLEGDLAVSIKLIEQWIDGTQLPEADPSPSS